MTRDETIHKINSALIRDDNGEIISDGPTGYLNVRLVLDHDDLFSDGLFYNKQTKGLEYYDQPLDESSMLWIMDDLAMNYCLWNPDIVERAVRYKAYENPYNPYD